MTFSIGSDLNSVESFLALFIGVLCFFCFLFTVYYNIHKCYKKWKHKKYPNNKPKYIIDPILPYYRQSAPVLMPTKTLYQLRSYSGKINRHGMIMTPVPGKSKLIDLDSK